MADVNLVDLEVIKRYSLAIRQESAPADEVLAVLELSRDAVLAAMAAEPPGRGAAEPPGRGAAEPPGRGAAAPPAKRAATSRKAPAKAAAKRAPSKTAKTAKKAAKRAKKASTTRGRGR